MIKNTFNRGVNFTNLSIVDENQGASPIKMISVDFKKMGTQDKNRILNSVATNVSTKLKGVKGEYGSTTALVGDMVDYIHKHGRIDSEIIHSLISHNNRMSKLFQGEHTYRQFDKGLYTDEFGRRAMYHDDLQGLIENGIDEAVRKK